MKKVFLFLGLMVGVTYLGFGGEKDAHQVIYQTIYQKKVIKKAETPKVNQPAYINESYTRDYYYHACMKAHQQKPITSVYRMAKNITDQLVCSELTPIRAPIGVSVIVDLNNLRQTTDFGRLLSEDLISELQRKNMAVVDIRSQTFMLINHQGEFYLSRSVKNLRDQYRLGYILVGTYSVGNFTTDVNARIINAQTGFVIATAHTSIPTQIVSDILYNSAQNIPTIELRGTPLSEVQAGSALPPPSPNTPNITTVPSKEIKK